MEISKNFKNGIITISNIKALEENGYRCHLKFDIEI